MAQVKRTKDIVVAGDVLIDHHIYAGERASLLARDRRGVREVKELGGAHLLFRLMGMLVDGGASRAAAAAARAKDDAPRAATFAAEAAAWRSWTTHLAIEPPRLDAAPAGYDGYAFWKPCSLTADGGGGAAQVWRADRLLGYGDGAAGAEDALPAGVVPDPDLLVLDDGGFLCRHAADDASRGLIGRIPDDGWILLKMSEPVAQGELWHFLLNSKHHVADRLICLVAARDLRRERLGLGRGLSWEATLDDLRVALHSHPAGSQLLRCRHLIVTFSADGALWIDQPKHGTPAARACLDLAHAEGEWAARFSGSAVGFHCTMAAALGFALAQYIDARRNAKPGADPPLLDLAPAVEAGLLAMRDLQQFGHGAVAAGLPAGYPVQRLARKILDARDGKLPEAERLVPVAIDWPDGAAIAVRPNWSIVEASQHPFGNPARRPLLGIAWQVATRGPAAVLERLPRARFGKLVTADRVEIETLRHLRQQMQAYANNSTPKRPFSIGVFGPPGAGKSFGVQQLADDVFGTGVCREFNLSQFRGPTDLIGAFHQVRDMGLGNLTPVVFWDEFDSRELEWLQYLLAPMQDGRFQDGQLSHRIGKCVFVFAGGTSRSFAEFSPPADASDQEKAVFRLRKGPDFISRLDAFVDVLGPNPRLRQVAWGWHEIDRDDIGWPLRRAFLIRAYLGCGPAEGVDFDPDLLNALLRVGHYRQGARSLEKLIDMLGGDNGGGNPRAVRRSALPRPAQLAVHVDVEEFMHLMAGIPGNMTTLDDGAVEIMAAAIHETWRDLAKEEGWQMQPHLDKPYATLAPIDKEDNQAAARRMPEVLALIGLGLRGPGNGAEPAVPEAELNALIEQNIDRLAEAEHDGWKEHREKNGWRWAETRNDARKLHPDMIRYAALPEREKGKDRNSLRHYPDFAARAGYRIVRLG